MQAYKLCVLKPKHHRETPEASGVLWGYNSGGTIQGNYAFSGMTANNLLVSDGTADDRNGADMSVGQIYSSAFWTDTDKWSAGVWNNTVWSFQNGKLPVLQNFAEGTQSDGGGVYLIERDIANADIGTINNLTYNGSQQIPNLNVTFDGVSLVKDKDYTIEITSSDGPGTSGGTNAGAVTIKHTGRATITAKKPA
jgi:hypothetical protein